MNAYADAEAAEDVVDDLDKLQFVQHRGGTDDIDVALIEFAITAFLRTVCAPDRLNLVALEWKYYVVLVLYHIAGKRYREVIAKSFLADLHGLGPISQILNIHRGDKMNYLVSLSSDEAGLSSYAAERFGKDSEQATTKRALGDMNTTLVRTEKGKSIMIQHDVSDATPYSRLHTIRGTKGVAQKYPIQGIAIDPEAERFMTGAQLDSMLAAWEHPLTKELGAKAKEVGGHGGMDYIMNYRLIHCLHNGLPLDEDVYDAAEWSCLVELSEISVKNGSAPVEVPDFTRGAWNKIDGFHLAGY